MTVYAPFLIYAKGTQPINAQIKQNKNVVDLTGKTVTATCRAINDWDTVIDAALEDQPVTVVTAATGIVQWQINAALLSGNPRSPLKGNPYGIQFFVVEDNYYPELLVIGARDAN